MTEKERVRNRVRTKHIRGINGELNKHTHTRSSKRKNGTSVSLYNGLNYKLLVNIKSPPPLPLVLAAYLLSVHFVLFNSK